MPLAEQRIPRQEPEQQNPPWEQAAEQGHLQVQREQLPMREELVLQELLPLRSEQRVQPEQQAAWSVQQALMQPEQQAAWPVQQAQPLL